MKYKIEEEVSHSCLITCDIKDCKSCFGIYFSQVNCKIIDCYKNFYLAEFYHFKNIREPLKVLKENLDEKLIYDNIEVRTICPIKRRVEIYNILNRGKISAEIVGDLFSTYGFPVDLSELILEENNLFVDERNIQEYIILKNE